jgi:hypothetical protein
MATLAGPLKDPLLGKRGCDCAPAALGAFPGIVSEGVDQKMPGNRSESILTTLLDRSPTPPRKSVWSDAATMGWEYGIKKSFLKALLEYW